MNAVSLEPRYEKALQPVAGMISELFAELVEELRTADTPARLKLYDACHAVTTSTDCSWQLFEAAQLVRAALPANRATVQNEESMGRGVPSGEGGSL